MWAEISEPFDEDLLEEQCTPNVVDYSSKPQYFVPKFDNTKEQGLVIFDAMNEHTIALTEYRDFMMDKIESKSFKRPPPELPTQKEYNKLSVCYVSMSDKEAFLYRRKAASVLCSVVGFGEAESDALDVLADLIGECLTSIFTRLQQLEHRKILNQHLAFKSPLSQVLMEFGIGSVLNLPKFYDKYVIAPHADILNHCLPLRNMFHKAKQIKHNAVVNNINHQNN